MENQFISLQGLADKIAQQVNQIYDGQYKKDHLEALVNNARDLYERLVVLRHKAYEQESNTEQKTEMNFEIPLQELLNDNAAGEENSSFRQVSLMEIIEEVEEKESLIPEVIELNLEDEEDENVFFQDAPNSQDEAQANPVDGTPIYSLNDILAQQQAPVNMASKLGIAAVDDLKKAITMNQRFQFARELFNGDTELYEITISELNNAASDQIENKVSDLMKRHGWTVESIAFIELRELIQRRHGV
jgi:hypothetical protein